MLTPLYRSATAWTVIGLLSGLVYREVTRPAGFTGRTQLAFVHTHALTLGTLLLFLVLALIAALRAQENKWLRLFLPVWNVGLAITTVMLTIKGLLQVQGSAMATSPALAGIAGLGHITLSVGFVLLLLGLKQAVAEYEGRQTQTADTAHS